jgi:hypothetical protein
MRRRGSLAGAAALAALIQSAEAAERLEPLSAYTLHALCQEYLNDPESRNGMRCMRYVQGFLDGVIVGDPRPSPHGADTRESWIARAARTRLGARFDAFEAQQTRAYCLGDQPRAHRFIERLLARLDARMPERSTPAREVLWQTLEAHYRCAERKPRSASR